MKKKIFFSTLIFAAVFGATTFLKLEFVRAAVTDATGWLWGGSEETNDAVINNNETGLGWISFNSSDAGAGGGASYFVNVPIAGDVTGYAWSENLGWIDFNPQNHCTTGAPTGDQYQALSCTVPAGYAIGSGGVSRTGNILAGWARFVGIAKATAEVPNNAGGLDGWIALGIGNGYDVSIDTAGSMSGYGWSELGAINFQGKAIVEPTVTITPASTLLNVATATLPQTVTLTWSSTAADSCGVSSTTGAWNQANIGTAGTHDVSVPSGMNETFTITCVGPGGTKSAIALISTVCYPLGCEMQKCVDNTAKPKLGAANTAVCAPLDTCKIDGDCQTRDMSEWSEVTP